MQQAIDYAETLDIPFVFTSNGDAFLFHDRTVDLIQYWNTISEYYVVLCL